jgi:hypothetical protein
MSKHLGGGYYEVETSFGPQIIGPNGFVQPELNRRPAHYDYDGRAYDSTGIEIKSYASGGSAVHTHIHTVAPNLGYASKDISNGAGWSQTRSLDAAAVNAPHRTYPTAAPHSEQWGPAIYWAVVAAVFAAIGANTIFGT